VVAIRAAHRASADPSVASRIFVGNMSSPASSCYRGYIMMSGTVAPVLLPVFAHPLYCARFSMVDASSEVYTYECSAIEDGCLEQIGSSA
jgi:hypothetical protein